jgi:hypothetical protein
MTVGMEMVVVDSHDGQPHCLENVINKQTNYSHTVFSIDA